MGDIDDDGVLDLIVGAGKDHAPEVVVYAGKAKNGKPAFTTELVRFNAFAADARGGIGVAAAQVDGTTADNIIVGSGPGIPSEVRGLSLGTRQSSPAQHPRLFSTFTPYSNDRSGVSLATGFVDFSTGRHSIVTAPGAGSTAEVKVFAFPLLTPTGKGFPEGHGGLQPSRIDQPALTATFVPVRQGLPWWRFARDRFSGWLAWWCGKGSSSASSPMPAR